MRKILFFTFLIVATPFWASSETGNKLDDAIDTMIETHPLRFLIFRIQPKISVGSGYDSNSLLNPEQPVGDYYSSIEPAASIALKLGRTAFLLLDEELNFLYYRDLEQLRDIFSSASLSLITGSERILLTFAASHVNKKAPISSEFDIPAHQNNARGSVEIIFNAGRGINLKFGYQISQSLYERDKEIVIQISPPPDTRERKYAGAIDYLLADEINLELEWNGNRTEFLNAEQVSSEILVSDSWQVLTGVVFTGRRVIGRAKAGFGQRESILAEEGTFGDLLIDTDVEFRIKKRLATGVFLNRNRAVSALLPGSFHVVTEGGVRGSLPLFKRLFVDGEFKIGKNNYGNRFVSGAGPLTKDHYSKGELGLNYELVRNLVLRGGIGYLRRESNLELLSRDRWFYQIGLGFEMAPD